MIGVPTQPMSSIQIDVLSDGKTKNAQVVNNFSSTAQHSCAINMSRHNRQYGILVVVASCAVLLLVFARILLPPTNQQAGSHSNKHEPSVSAYKDTPRTTSTKNSVSIEKNTTPSLPTDPGTPTTREELFFEEELFAECDTYAETLEEFEAMGEHLALEDVKRIGSWLIQGSCGELTHPQCLSFKNIVLDKLVNQREAANAIGPILIEVYNVELNRDEVVGDYIVQHLKPYYELIVNMGLTNDTGIPMVEDVEAIFWSATEQTHCSIAGTALLGMTRLSHTCPASFDEADLGTRCLDIVNNPNSAAVAKIGALQAATMLGSADIINPARQLAVGSDDFVLRVSSIAVLGQLGDASDVELLYQMSLGAEDRLNPAISGCAEEAEEAAILRRTFVQSTLKKPVT